MAEPDLPIDTSSPGLHRTHARRAGVSLVETAAIISLVGVLTAAFIPTFKRHLRLSKIAEAVDQLESMQRALDAYYQADHTLGLQRARGCLPESAGPFPERPSPEPVLVDYDAPETPARDIWHLLGLSGEHSLRYSYEVVVAEPGCGPRRAPATPAVTLRAFGDLDGDGVLSTLEREAAISPDQRRLETVGPLHIHQRVE